MIKKVDEIVIDDVKIILNVDGEEFEAIPATPEELAEVEKESILGSCKGCGKYVCYKGHVWVCRWRRPKCTWFKTNVLCNE